MLLKVPLVLEPQSEGGFTVTSPLLPELVTEGDSAAEAIANVSDALQAVLELYRESNRALPPNLVQRESDGPVWLETVVVTS
ncbi:MAG: type II toxin-antitoxin system HicB family antitoxin [Phycisphaerales bacterium]|nr:type II toxin-antitoxin system HicB family antitoxin [Phycisphaerales bacterium]